MMTQVHVEPLPTPLIKVKYDGKSDKYFVKLNMHRHPTSSMSDFYKSDIALFENDKPEELFCLFVT